MTHTAYERYEEVRRKIASRLYDELYDFRDTHSRVQQLDLIEEAIKLALEKHCAESHYGECLETDG